MSDKRNYILITSVKYEGYDVDYFDTFEQLQDAVNKSMHKSIDFAGKVEKEYDLIPLEVIKRIELR